MPADKTALAAIALQALGAAARKDPAALLELAFRSEDNRSEPIKCAPHQRLLFEFTQANRFSVIRMPRGFSKTFCLSALLIWQLGKDASQRCAVLSDSNSQSEKVLAAVRDYLADPELSAMVRVAFPTLRPWFEKKWTQSAITVERPPGIRDPSVRAYGAKTRVYGSRLGWLLCDDLVSDENALTAASRADTVNTFLRAFSCLHPDSGRAIVANTPWHPDDLTYVLEQRSIPTLTMNAYGDIRIANIDFADSRMSRIAKLVRPSRIKQGVYRLVVHDPDPEEQCMLWESARGSRAAIEEWRAVLPGSHFAKFYLCEPWDDETSRCPREWIDQCLSRGSGLPIDVTRFDRSQMPEGAITVTGVDLAAGSGANETVFFTCLAERNGDLTPLMVDAGNFTAPKQKEILIKHHQIFGSIVFVEDNGVQSWLRQITADECDIPIFAHRTGRNKWDPRYGVESVFLHMQQCKWRIPSRAGVAASKPLDRWLDQCQSFKPSNHTGDLLMASWICKEGARSRMPTSTGYPMPGEIKPARKFRV